MKTLVIGKSEFQVLTPAEAEERFADCDHVWMKSDLAYTVNPSGEYVEGYGTTPVSVVVKHGQICCECGIFREKICAS